MDTLRIGIITASDRGSRGEYDYLSGEEVQKVVLDFFLNPVQFEHSVIPDERDQIANELIRLTDVLHCHLVLTTGGTGPAPRDVTPEATMDVCSRLLPGYGEEMRRHSLQYVKSALLSRQTAGIRNESLIINMPGRPRAIRQCIEAIVDTIPHAVLLLGGPRIELRKTPDK